MIVTLHRLFFAPFSRTSMTQADLNLPDDFNLSPDHLLRAQRRYDDRRRHPGVDALLCLGAGYLGAHRFRAGRPRLGALYIFATLLALALAVPGLVWPGILWWGFLLADVPLTYVRARRYNEALGRRISDELRREIDEADDGKELARAREIAASTRDRLARG